MLVAVASVIAFFAAGALADCRKFEIAPVMARTSQMSATFTSLSNFPRALDSFLLLQPVDALDTVFAVRTTSALATLIILVLIAASGRALTTTPSLTRPLET